MPTSARGTWLIVMAAATAALALAACGEDREDGGAGDEPTAAQSAPRTGAPAVARVEVAESEYRLDPANPSIEEPGVVEFAVRNVGREPHALEIETAGGEVETEQIAPGGSATLEADLKPGRYVWYCPVGDHEQRGMRGSVTVAGRGSGGGTGESGRGEPGDEPGGGSPGGGY